MKTPGVIATACRVSFLSMIEINILYSVDWNPFIRLAAARRALVGEFVLISSQFLR